MACLRRGRYRRQGSFFGVALLVRHGRASFCADVQHDSFEEVNIITRAEAFRLAEKGMESNRALGDPSLHIDSSL